MRGEYTFGFEAIEFAEELPPRARRIPSTLVEAGPIVGTTSACAENTPPGVVTMVSDANYLRVRGEYPH